MIVIYKKGTHEFVGMAPKVNDNGNLREFTFEELYPNLDPKEHGWFFVEDSPKYVLHPNHWQFKLGRDGEPVGIEFRPRYTIRLTTDAPDEDGDGMPELKADGSSSAKIKVEIMDGQKVKGVDTQVKLSTTAGRLDTRLVKLTKRKKSANVNLTASTDTVTVTVTATAPDMDPGSITFELMP